MSWLRTSPARRFLLLLAWWLAASAHAVESGPQGIVRRFCQADGVGQRVSIHGWQAVAPLVDWSFEPAWDHVVLVSGYTVGSPQASDRDALAVEVRYTVTGYLSAAGLESGTRVESVVFRVHAPDDAGWRIIGPPPAPHLFESRVDTDAMRQSLESGGVNFVANSSFVWQMLRSAGWNVDFERTTDLLKGTVYRAVEVPAIGDLVVYLRDGAPYHVGLLAAQDQVVSSTLNAGIVRAAPHAFPGQVKYLRIVQPEAAPPTAAVAPAPTKTSRVGPSAPKARRTAPAALHKREKTSGRTVVRRTPQPSHGGRVRATQKRVKQRPRPTPVATRQQ